MIAELVYEDEGWKSPLLHVDQPLRAGQTFKYAVPDHPAPKWEIVSIEPEQRVVFGERTTVRKIGIIPANWPPQPQFRPPMPEDVTNER